MNFREPKISIHDARGVSLLEVLVSIGILSLITLNITYSSITNLRVFKRTLRNTIAASLAAQQIELYASLDPQVLDDTYDDQETIYVQNIPFIRTTNVTVNSDQSRTVFVRVEGERFELGGVAEYETTYSLWGEH